MTWRRSRTAWFSAPLDMVRDPWRTRLSQGYSAPANAARRSGCLFSCRASSTLAWRGRGKLADDQFEFPPQPIPDGLPLASPILPALPTYHRQVDALDHVHAEE